MYLLSPKVKRLGTKGSENSENVSKIQLKISNSEFLKLWRSSSFSLSIKGIHCEMSSFIFKQTTNNMKKYRISFTVQDYYNYIGTNPYYSAKERMLKSIPDLFKKNGYNIKFKCIHSKWNKYYRVHMSVRMCEKDIKQVLDWYKNASFKLDNVSYKLITKHF